MKKVTSSIFLLIIFSFILNFNSATAQKKEIKINLKGFDEFVEKIMKEWKVPGLSIAIVKDDRVVYSKGFGLRDVENNLQVTTKTLFPIASCTKAFTTAGMGILKDKGKLDFDKPVRNYLPALKLSDDQITEKITPRDLVTHRSGLPRHDWVWWRSGFSRKELFARLRFLEFNKGLRESYQYNNLMFMTAGIMIEEITQTAWEEFIQKKILDPLEMKSTNFFISEMQKTDDYSLPYIEVKGVVKKYSYCDMDALGPAGSINSNVIDMTNWVILNLNQGKFKDRQIISESSLKELQKPQVVSSSSMDYDEVFYSNYGMGWGITSYREHVMLSHWGGIDGFASLVSMLSKDKIGLVILCNHESTPVPGIIAYNVYDRFLGLKEVDWNQRNKDRVAKDKEKSEKEKRDTIQKSGTQPTHHLEDYSGKYENPGYGIITIIKDGNDFKLTFNGISTMLKHYHYDVFQAEDEENYEKMKFTFFMNNRGEIDKVTAPFETNVKNIIFSRINKGN